MAMKKDSAMVCNGSCMCSRCKGGRSVVTGVLLYLGVANAWFGDPWKVVVALLVLGGLARWVKPCCGHCK